jgi:hypothetical protein
MREGDTFGESIRINCSFDSSRLNLTYEGLLLGMRRGNHRESLTKSHLVHVDFCPRWFCRDEQHRLEMEPPPVVRPSTPLKPILLEVVTLYSDGAEARPKLRRAIIGVELIKGPEATEEYMPAKVHRGRHMSKGHVLIHDWRGTEIIVNMKGL